MSGRPPEAVYRLIETRGAGDRTKSDVESAQVIDSLKGEKRQTRLIRPSEVHRRYT